MLRRLYLFAMILAVVFSTHAYAISQNVKAIDAIAQTFTRTPISPSRYLSFVREINDTDDGMVEQLETWEVELEPNSNGNAALYFVPVLDPVTRYVETSAFLIDVVLAPRALQVQYDFSKSGTSADGTPLRVEVAYVAIPVSSRSTRIKLRFRISGKKTTGIPPAARLQLPGAIAVDAAELMIHTNKRWGSAATFGGLGFELASSKIIGEILTQQFVLKKPWTPTNGGKQADAPQIFASYTTWREAAQRAARPYRHELAAPITSSPSVVLEASKWLTLPGRPKSPREMSYQILEWLKRTLDARISFDLNHLSQPRSIDRISASGSGDCKDLALIYIKILSLAGIDAEPVEVLLDPNLGPYPVASGALGHYDSNHVIVFIPELNEYIDPTAPSSEFATTSSRFSNTYGLHLFSKRFQLIKPDSIAENISIETSVEKMNGQWIGKTRFTGKGLGYLSLISFQKNWQTTVMQDKGLEQRFETDRLILKPGSLAFNTDALTATSAIDFSYFLRFPPVDENGKIFRSLSNAITNFSLAMVNSRPTTEDGYFCFATTLLTERVEITGASTDAIPGKIRDVKISGVNSEFTQTITLEKSSLLLNRRFTVNEKRAFCSESERSLQQAFLVLVQSTVNQTHVAVELELQPH